MADNPDTGLGVEFFTKAVEHPAKTREAGRPIFNDMEYVRISFPGDSKRELVAPASEMHYVSHAKQQMTYAERFAGSYAAFKDSNTEYVSGTPIDELTALTASKKAELKAMKIRTVEQLAGLPDVTIKKIGMGAREMVEQAQAFLAAASGTAEIAELRRQLAELQAAKAAPETSDEFSGFSEEDLKNMIQDAGGEVPRGNAKRETLVARLQEIAAQKTEAA